MNIITVVFALVLLICKMQAQFCGCGGPSILPSPLPTNFLSNPPQLMPTSQVTPVASNSVVGTTIIDNSLSNTLANVLQLLIVSDLIESTLNTALGLHSLPLVNPICESTPQPMVYTPTTDVITPVVEYISPPCSSVIDFIPSPPVVDFIAPTAPVFDFVPNFGQIDYKSPCAPVIDFIPPCAPVFDFIPQYGPIIDYTSSIGPSCGPFIEPLPNFYGEYIPPMPNLTPIPGVPNYCGGSAEYVSPITNIYTQTFTPNFIGGIPEIIGPVQMAPFAPNCYNGLTEIMGPHGNMGPLSTDITYPSSIPNQMSCNVGTIPASLPCVSINVEPLPCGCGYGNNIIGTPYFY